VTVVARTHPFVIGVDTHAKTHAVSILVTPNGQAVDHTVSRHARGYGPRDRLGRSTHRWGFRSSTTQSCPHAAGQARNQPGDRRSGDGCLVP